MEKPKGDNEWRQLPVAVRWALALVSLAVLFTLMALTIDIGFVRALEHWPEGERAAFEALTRWGESDWILYPTLLVSLAAFGLGFVKLSYTWRWFVRALGAVAWLVFVGVGVPGLIVQIIKRLVGRARPFLFDQQGALSFHFLPPDWTLHSFPSGHSATAFALAYILTRLTTPAWGWLFYAWAVLIALSRITTGAHYPSDVVAGTLLGWFAAKIIVANFERRGFPVATRKGKPANPSAPLIWRGIRKGFRTLSR
ncbi:MAG: phosphatase PAP2 family protein [Hyphomicrobiaceae bacterium]|nr:phosphatase PAP2 family protein [Hyphomicrobiaceae bacterium]